MAAISTRREFIQRMTAGGALCGMLAGSSGAQASPAAGTINRQALDAELRRRAQQQLAQRRLVVDYYRIRRQLAYPLPLPRLSLPEVVVPGIQGYPWATWLLWTLEERIMALGWTAEWFQDGDARRAASADLAALAQWPEYRQYDSPDLSSGHAGRILWTAATRWPWVDETLRRRLREACCRHVESVLPRSDKHCGAVHTKDDILHLPKPHALLHNIALIGTVGAALTACAAKHPAADSLNRRVAALFGAVLELRGQGFSEGVAYDGYVLDFIADWLATLPEPDRAAILDHPHLTQYLEESYRLSAPGAVQQVAEIGDVEPREMPFHLSAQAKLLGLRRDPVRAWLLERCPADWLRTDALAALRSIDMPTATATPAAGALDAHYALVLRSGWEAKDLAAAISCSSSPMGHLLPDSGTLVIGTQRKWLITDPGYQQYAKGDEREFTVGPTAHNAPLINGTAQTQKSPRRLVLAEAAPGVYHAAVDLAACYPRPAAPTKLVRHVWLAGNHVVVVADQIEASAPPRATYHWHGHPDAAWWFESDAAMLTLDGSRLWVTCAQAGLSGAELQRLPGSRGQLSLIASIDSAGPVVWWAFVLAAQPPTLSVSPDSRALRLLDRTFSLS